MEGGQKRRPKVRLAAIDSDEEDFFEVQVKKKPRAAAAKPDPGAGEEAATEAGGQPASAGVPPKKKKKEKEFAWMDSEEEDEEDEKKEDGGERAADEDNEVQIAEKEETATLEALEAVQSFGRMMLLAPSLQRWLRGGTMGPLDVIAACRAIERTKFFDGDIQDELYPMLRKMLAANMFDMVQTNDVLSCLRTLNAYDKGVLGAVARCFAAKTMAMEAEMRHFWLDTFKAFKHTEDKAFLQLLEVPPVIPGHPAYKKVRCWHYSKGSCVLGEAACTFSHDQRAPLSLADAGKEDFWKTKSLIMTQNQKSQGNGSYGFGRLGVDQKD